MVALPILATLVSLAFTALILRDARRSPRPDKLSWAIAFAIFTVAAGAEVIGDLAGWSVALARVYYLTGAVLVTLFLGLGQLYLLWGPRIARFAPGLTLLLVVFAASLVYGAPVDRARLDADHWRAIDRGPLLITVVAASNAFGVIALLGGSLWSAWQFRRTRTRPHRLAGCLLIALGTLVIASKGYLERLGVPVSDFGFYLLLTVGAVIIFGGYLETRRREPVPIVGVGVDAAAGLADPALVVATGAMPLAGGESGTPAASVAASPVIPDEAVAVAPTDRWTNREGFAGDPGIGFIEGRFLPLEDDALDALATAWSAPRVATGALTTEQARRVWALRGRLSPSGRIALDGHGLPAALQLADLYETVLMSPSPTGSGSGASPVEPLTLLGASRPAAPGH